MDDNAVIHHVQLVNKRLYLLATQRLYRHFNMTLVADSSMNYTYEQYLTNHIEGHDFIRDLEVSLKVEADVDPTPAYQWLSQLLEHLPQNNLTHFRSNFNGPLPPHLLRKLWSTQTRLKNLEIFPNLSVDDHHPTKTEHGCISVKNVLECTEFSDLESLRIVPDCSETASLCSTVLHKSQNQAPAAATGWMSTNLFSTVAAKEKVRKVKPITALAIDGCQWREPEQQGMTAEDRLVESLFAHVPRVYPGQKGALSHLTALMLKDVSLKNSRSTWHTYLNLGNLQHLEIHYCPGADMFLRVLANDRADTPTLTTLSIIHDLGERQSDRTIEALDILLRCMGGKLEDLELCLRNTKRLPQIGSIAQHGDTLRSLVMDIMRPARVYESFLVYQSEELREMLSPCTQLRELALGLTDFNVNSMRYNDSDLEIDQHLRAIFRSTTLDVLSILNVPSVFVSEFYLEGSDHALGRVAVDVYSLHQDYDHGVHPLRFLSFGNRVHNKVVDHRFYVVTTCEALGKTRYASVYVTLENLRKEGLASKLIDYQRRDFDKEHRKQFNPTESRD